jgi:hypothetical protein
MTEWYFQPTDSRYYTKLGGIGKSRWFGTRVPVIEGIFIPSDMKKSTDMNTIPATEIQWIMREGKMLMTYQNRLDSFFGTFSILQTSDDFETAKRITGFKPYTL